jgi:hypothetical protein
MRIRSFWAVFSLASLACAGGSSGPAPSASALPTSRSELARGIVEAGAARGSVAEVVEGFRGLAIERVGANVRALEAQLGKLPAERREGVRGRLAAMPSRFETDLDAFLASIDFEGLAVDLFAPAYAERFSVEELQAILRFYRSPAGAAFARESAGVQSAGTAELASRLETTLENFMRQWFDDQLQGVQPGAGPAPTDGGSLPRSGASEPGR